MDGVDAEDQGSGRGWQPEACSLAFIFGFTNEEPAKQYIQEECRRYMKNNIGDVVGPGAASEKLIFDGKGQEQERPIHTRGSANGRPSVLAEKAQNRFGIK